jgi:hypothetical protein
MTGMNGLEDIDMRVYTGSDFSTGYLICAYSSRSGTLPEECDLASGTYYILVINYGTGGTYLITAD